MSHQLFLNLDAPPEDPGASRETSRAAKEATDANRGRALVLAYLESQGPHGATRDELCEALGLSSGSVCPRCVELLKAGQIYETVERRMTRSGRTAVVLCRRGV